MFTGATHGFQKMLIRGGWSPDGERIACGSADRNVYVWDFETTTLQYALPGHKGSVNEVALSPTEPIVVSASSDNTLYLGEIQPTDAM